MIHIINSSEHRDEWISVWEQWDAREVYAHPDYIDLYVDEYSQSLCAVSRTDNGVIIYPFIRRSLRKEPHCCSCSDIITPYGYGGIYTTGEVDGDSVRRFCDEFALWAADNGIVCEFIRFALDSHSRECYNGQIEENNMNVVVDLTMPSDQMWGEFKHKVRKNVNKAKGYGIEIVFDSNGSMLDDFLCIYYGTMDRRNAGSGYYFSESYFRTIIDKLKGQFVFAHALFESKIISTELVLVSQHNIYSFLGGTSDEYFDMRPNDLLKYEIINWGREHGRKRFILGGGYAPMDGIYQYKLAFAPYGAVPFFVGHRIFCENEYNQLVEKRRAGDDTFNLDSDFFPLYRS